MGLPLIEFGNDVIDFKRHFNEVEITREINKSEFEASSGEIQVDYLYSRNKIRLAKDRLEPGLVQSTNKLIEYLSAGEGRTCNLWLDRNIKAYFDFEAKSLKSNDGIECTFANRGTSATYIDPVTGLLTTVAPDEMRFPEGRYGRGLLVENNHTNKLLYSAQFDNSVWTKTNITISANTTETYDPAGQNYANKISLTNTESNGTIVQNISESIGTNSANFSIFVKSIVINTTIKLRIKDSINTILAEKTYYLTPQWKRYDVDFRNYGNNTNNWRVEIVLVSDQYYYPIYIWGAQLDIGVDYMRSYIGTYNVPITQGAEKISYIPDASHKMDMQAGTIAFWVKFPWLSTAMRNLLICKMVNNQLEIYQLNGSLYVEFPPYMGSVLYLATGISESWQNEWIHIATTWSFPSENYQYGTWKLYINGNKVNETGLSGTPLPLTEILIGCDATKTYNSDAILDDIIILSEILSEERIKQIALSPNALGIGKNYFTNLILDSDEYSPKQIYGGDKYDWELELKEDTGW